MKLELQYANGQFAALARMKLAFPAATDPTVQGSAVLQNQDAKPMSDGAKQRLAPPTTPFSVSQLFDVHEQAKTRVEPTRKLGGDLCTSCRKEKHYGPCKRPIPIKRGDFNMGMNGSDPTGGNDPSTSPHYHSATSDSALARSRDGRPADEQAATGFADLFRHQGIRNSSDEPGRMYGGLNKVAADTESARRRALLFKMYGVDLAKPKLADVMLPGSVIHSMYEKRGPTVNPYEAQRTKLTPPVGWGDEGEQRISRAFGQIDNAADSTNIGGGSGQPDGGPAVLG